MRKKKKKMEIKKIYLYINFVVVYRAKRYFYRDFILKYAIFRRRQFIFIIFKKMLFIITIISLRYLLYFY